MAENNFFSESSESPKGNIAILIYGLTYLLLGLIAILLALPFISHLLDGTSNTVYNRFLMALVVLGIVFIVLSTNILTLRNHDLVFAILMLLVLISVLIKINLLLTGLTNYMLVKILVSWPALVFLASGLIVLDRKKIISQFRS